MKLTLLSFKRKKLLRNQLKASTRFNPADSIIIYRAQSILTMGGVLGPTLPYAQALDVVNWAEQK